MEKNRILVVEDEFVTATALRITLEDFGFTVAGTADTGEDAIRMAEELRPDIVLMDIQLIGEMNGIAAAAIIRKNYDIPVIYVTGQSDDATIARALESEPFGYIIKPFEEKNLKASISMALYKHALDEKLRHSEETSRLLVNTTRDILFLLGSDGTILLANDSFGKMVKKKPDDLPGTSIFDLVAQQLITSRMACWNMDPGRKTSIHFEEELKKIWFDVTIYPHYDREGRPLKYAVYIRDVTEQKRIARQLTQNQEFFRSLIEEASDITAVLNQDFSFSRQSPSLKRTLMYPKEIAMDKTLFDLVHHDDLSNAYIAFSDLRDHPGMIKPFRLKFSKHTGGTCVIKGIVSNLLSDTFVGALVLNGWVERG